MNVPIVIDDRKIAGILEEVHRERLRQEKMKAEGRFRFTCADSDPDAMTDSEKLAVLGEEAGEAIDEYIALRLQSLMGRVAREVLTQEGRRLARDTEGTPEALRKELIQVCAVSVAWIESLS